MASIKKIEGKTGTSYKITVTLGRDSNGKQIRHYKTWTPDRPMTARQMEKEAQRMATTGRHFHSMRSISSNSKRGAGPQREQLKGISAL